MNTSVFKVSGFRYGMIILLIAGLCAVIGYLGSRYNQVKKLHGDVEKLMMIRSNSDQIDNCLLMLYMADNDSRMYSLSSDPKYLQSFALKVHQVDSILTRLKSSKINPINTSFAKISSLMDQKGVETTRYLKLRVASERLIKELMTGPKAVVLKTDSLTTTVSAIRTDTLKKTKRKKLLGRIAAAFSGTRSGVPDTVSQPMVSAVPTSVLEVPRFQNDDYRKFNQANSGLKMKEKEILSINSRITGELITVLNRYKAEEQLYLLKGKKALRGTLKSIFTGFSDLSLFAATIIALLISALLYNIWKIFRQEKRMLAYSVVALRNADEKSTFLANMSHEIRTPLNSIAGFAEQLEQGRLNKEQYGQIKAVRSSAGMLLNVVNQVLDFTKYENGKMSFDHAPFLLDDVIDDVVVSMEVLAEQKGLVLLVDLGYPKNLYLIGDAFRLKQVMINLLGNAIKFTKVGEVSIEVKAILKSGLNYELQVLISDTGTGIGVEDLPLIFKKFSQATATQKQNRAGTGLGLAISKSIIELQNGSIAVKSKLGKGSEFSFILPFILGSAAPSKENDAENEHLLKIFLKDKHVLLAEDNSLNVMLAKTILSKWGMTCNVAHNGKEALALLAENTYDILLTDIQMPEMDGQELAVEVRRHPDQLIAGLPILALTANVMKDDHQQYLKSGIDAVAMKPFLEKDLILKISKLLKAAIPAA